MKFSAKPAEGSPLFPSGTTNAGSSNILDRTAAEVPSLTQRQAQVDGMVEGFVHQATDLKSLAALTAGGLAYRAGRVGTMGFRLGAYGHTPLRVVSIATGLAAEVSAFEMTHRTLVGARFPRPQFLPNGTGGETPPLHPENPNLWKWSGPN